MTNAPRQRRRLSPRDKSSLVGMCATIAALHLIGFGVLLAVVAPRHYALGGDHPVFTVGVGILAYTFGLRHAFDVDHIAAIDNTVRKLVDDAPADRAPLSVGFWFALGHATVVFTLSFLLAAGTRALAGPLTDEGSALHVVTGVIGPSVSGIFLCAIGIINLAALVGIGRAIRDMRRGQYDDAELQRHLDSRGFINRFLGRLTRGVRKPWHIYPIGVLFGLGFDTATEVGLLVLAGGAAAFDMPFYVIMVLPVLFAAGMCLLDSTDGVFMNYAYRWAFATPSRKLFYNFTVTALSVAVALLIGGIELIGVLANRLGIDSGPLAAIAHVDLGYAGFAVVGVFVLAWVAAVAVRRVRA